MTKRKDKARFSAMIHKTTYDKVNDFVKNNELITARLVPGTILEIGLNMFFKEVSKRPLEEIAIEYLNDGRPGASDNE